MTTTQTAGERIIEEVTSWPGVERRLGRARRLSLRLGRREIGHLHGDHALHAASRSRSGTSFTTPGASTTTRSFRASPATAARRIEDEADVDDAIALLRLNYERAVAERGLPSEVGD